MRWNHAVTIAATSFGVTLPRQALPPSDVIDFLLEESTTAPELWNQRSYLARVLSFDPERGITDDGIQPLAHFVDAAGPNAVALTVETDDTGDIHPAVYVRRAGQVAEHTLPGDPLLDFRTREHRSQLASLLSDLLK